MTCFSGGECNQTSLVWSVLLPQSTLTFYEACKMTFMTENDAMLNKFSMPSESPLERQQTELSFFMSDKGFKAHLFHCTCFHWRQHFSSELHSFVCSTLHSDARRSSLTVTQPPGVQMTTTTIGMTLPQMRRQKASVLFHLEMTCSPSKSSSQTTNPI
jgi:hypothetical protein